MTLEAVTSVDINTDEVSTTPKIKCANESCEKLCCPCTGDTCQNLCRSYSFKYLVNRSLCYKICCAVELRNITEVPEIVNIPHGEVVLLIQDTGIQIIRDYSLKITYNWEEIEITFCKITTIQPNVFKGFTKLKKLHLNDNLISHFYHGTFSDLHNLRYLTLYKNRLTSVYIFNGLPNLGLLQFSSNRITHLDNNSFCQSVNIEINISNSKISIPGDCKVTNIYSIDLSDNNLTTVAQYSFRPIENLEFLYLEKNRLKEIKNGTFEGNTKLTGVQLSRNKIIHFTKDSFPETLKRLDLDGNRLVHLD